MTADITCHCKFDQNQSTHLWVLEIQSFHTVYVADYRGEFADQIQGLVVEYTATNKGQVQENPRDVCTTGEQEARCDVYMLDPQSGLLEVRIARNRRPVTHFTYGSSIVIIPPAQRSCWGILVSLPPSVRHPSVRRPFVSPSVRPTSRVRSVALTVLVGSVSYLYILSSNFRRYVARKVYRKITKFEFLAFSKHLLL